MDAVQNLTFEQQLEAMQLIANFTDEQARDMYPQIAAKEKSEVVRQLLAEPKNIRVLFGATAMAMQRTKIGVTDPDKGNKKVLFEAMIEELKFLGRFTETEMNALYASGMETIEAE